MGRCLACSRNSKEVSVARAEGAKMSMVAGVREVVTTGEALLRQGLVSDCKDLSFYSE